MNIWVMHSCSFLAIFSGDQVRIYEFLFSKFRRVWFVGERGVKFYYCGKCRLYRPHPGYLILLSVNSYMVFLL